MKTTVKVRVRKSRFGKCVLTFNRGESDTNVYVSCDKDPNITIRVWFYRPTKRWACEVQHPAGYDSYGTQMLDGTYGWSTAEAAWKFAAKKTWE